MTTGTPNQDFQLYARLLGYLKPHRKRFIIALLFSLPVAGLQGVIAWLVGPITDELLKKQDFGILLSVPVFLVAVALVQGTCQYINEYCTTYVGNSITQTMRRELFAKLNSRSLSYFKKNTWSDIYSRYCVDPAVLQSAVNENLQDLIVKILTIIGLACVLLYRNWQYALISMLIISLIVVPIAIISKKIRKMDYVSREITVRLYAIAQEFTTGFKIMNVFRLQGYQSKRYSKTLDDLFAATMRINKAGILLKPLMQIIASVGIASVFAIGVLQIQNKTMTPGELTSFIVALIMLISPIKTVGSVISKMQRIFAPAERVFQKLDLPEEMPEAPNAQLLDGFHNIRFENVSFAYEPTKPVLKKINLEVQAGETIALVGPSGGGKSTLVDMIVRFLDPTEGQVLINGTDLRQLTYNTIRDQMAIVSQDAILFDSTIKENIALGRLGASDEDIQNAMDMAYLTDWVNSLEKGWDSPVGEWGCLLSGGQKQRITIARAFLKNAPVLILDEATSALDNESEAIVQQALMRLLDGRTVFVIAHRLSTIKHANRILVLDKGEIVESGNHDQLLKQEGLYHRLYHLQFKREQADWAMA